MSESEKDYEDNRERLILDANSDMMKSKGFLLAYVDQAGNVNFYECTRDLNNAEDRKYIKTIERLTQFGVDEKVDYDPIDRLVDIYNDLLGPNKIWNLKEYSKKLALKASDVEKMSLKAEIMADYLNYINKPNKFYIAKNLKLDGPLQELVTTFKKVSREEWNRIRISFYSLFSEKGDITRQTSNLNKIYKQDMPELQLIAVKKDPEVIRFIKNPSRELQEYVLKYEPRYINKLNRIDPDLKQQIK